MMTIIDLHTARLRLRDIQPPDWEAFYQLHSDPEVVRYLPEDAMTEAQTREMVRWAIGQAEASPRIFYDLAVVHRAEGAVIGWCRFAWRYDEVDQAEIAFSLQRPYWGQGLATELAQRLLQFGFQEMGAHRIFALCRPPNYASWRVLEKVGMRREGILRQHRWMKGGWHDSFLYATLDHEYQEQRK